MKLIELQREIDKPTLTAGDSNTSLLVIIEQVARELVRIYLNYRIPLMNWM
jgi:hypothetical protein